jgi:hypothetical protein
MSVQPEDFTDKPTGRGGAFPIGTSETDEPDDEPNRTHEENRVVSGGGVIQDDPDVPEGSTEATSRNAD